MIFATLGVIMLLACLSPGPDFVLVTKNALLGNRIFGIATAFGIASACMIHVLYNIIALDFLMKYNEKIVVVIRYLGAFYLVFLGAKSLLSMSSSQLRQINKNGKSIELSLGLAWRQGLLCNLLNPKAYLFLTSIFSVVIPLKTTIMSDLVLITMEIFLIVFMWFSILSVIYTYQPVRNLLMKFNKLIEVILSLSLIAIGFISIFI